MSSLDVDHHVMTVPYRLFGHELILMMIQAASSKALPVEGSVYDRGRVMKVHQLDWLVGSPLWGYDQAGEPP